MDNKGMIKIVEAVISVMIVLTVILVALRVDKPDAGPNYSDFARNILKEAASNPPLRREVLGYSEIGPVSSGDVYNFVDGRIPDFLGFELIACDLTSPCGISYYRGDVYSGERVISSDLNTYNPIKLRLFIWEKEQ